MNVDKVLMASPRGFCAGVEMAIKALAWLVRTFDPPVYCYHEIVHNRIVVDRFRSLGVVFVDDVAEVPPGRPIMLSAHGTAPEVVAAAEALGFERFGLVSHDVGAFLAQDYARRHPHRLVGLFFFDCPHFSLGRRWVEGGQIREIWYQSFHQLPLSAELVGSSREACRAYFRHFLSHWSHDPTAFDAVLEEWIDNFSKPGRLAGGFRWYAVASARRLKAMERGHVENGEPVPVPAYSLWGKSDPILRAEWHETLTEIFSDIRVELVTDAGHFVHWEQPALANQRIIEFFAERF